MLSSDVVTKSGLKLKLFPSIPFLVHSVLNKIKNESVDRRALRVVFGVTLHVLEERNSDERNVQIAITEVLFVESLEREIQLFDERSRVKPFDVSS